MRPLISIEEYRQLSILSPAIVQTRPKARDRRLRMRMCVCVCALWRRSGQERPTPAAARHPSNHNDVAFSPLVSRAAGLPARFGMLNILFCTLGVTLASHHYR
jgi:hypothetical protein